MSQTTITDQKSLALRIKRLIGHRAWRVITRPVAIGLKMVPQSTLFKVGAQMRANSYPYSLVQEGDVVVQVGAPSDLLRIGRSRAVFLAMRVGATGKALIFEPEPSSAREIQAYVERAGLADRVVVTAKGCWHEERVLRFWANPDHPASNLLEDVSEWDEAELRARGYLPSEVPVTTIDAVLDAHDVGSVKLISVTTNGSEEEILKGAQDALARTQYLALADTGPEIHALSQQFGFRNIAMDDRGFTSERQNAG